MAEARDWFDTMSEQDRRLFVQRALRGLGLYAGPLDGSEQASLREAIGVYQKSNDLIADGRLDFDLYASLIASDLALAKRPDTSAAPLPFKPKAEPPKQILELSLSTNKGKRPTFKVGENLTVTLQTNGDAFAYCYYKDHVNNIARIFPNRYQPNALVAGGSEIKVPGPNAQFQIVMEQAAAEEAVLCVAADKEVGLELPENLKGEDLAPLAVNSLDDVREAFRQAQDVQIVEALLPLQTKL